MADMNQDAEHLRLLTIFHYVVGGITALFSLLPGIHLGIGLWMLLSPEALHHGNSGAPAPEFVGWLFVCLGGAFILFGELLAILIIYSGRLIARREKHLFSFVTGALMCFFVPFGTLLGVFTLIVLSRHTVKRLYGQEI